MPARGGPQEGREWPNRTAPGPLGDDPRQHPDQVGAAVLVHDSTADQLYPASSVRPEGTDGLLEEALMSQDGMIGVTGPTPAGSVRAELGRDPFEGIVVAMEPEDRLQRGKVRGREPFTEVVPRGRQKRNVLVEAEADASLDVVLVPIPPRLFQAPLRILVDLADEGVVPGRVVRLAKGAESSIHRRYGVSAVAISSARSGTMASAAAFQSVVDQSIGTSPASGRDPHRGYSHRIEFTTYPNHKDINWK